MSAGLKLDRQGKLVVPESDLEDAIISLLCWDGWRVFRFGWALTEAKRELGEVSSPDLLAVRYCGCAPGLAEILWCEVKSRRGKADAGQKLWHDAERKRGALVWCAGLDFPATVDGFRDFYGASNLKRRIR